MTQQYPITAVIIGGSHKGQKKGFKETNWPGAFDNRIIFDGRDEDSYIRSLFFSLQHRFQRADCLIRQAHTIHHAFEGDFTEKSGILRFLKV